MRTGVGRSAVVLSALALLSASCTTAQLQGQASSYVIVDAMAAASGATPATFSGSLGSDVQTNVKTTIDGKEVLVPTVFEDPGRATFHLALKDPGGVNNPTTASSVNAVTFTSYHVTFTRADGRNTPGVDVPYPFDGGMTVTVGGGDTAIGQFTLVRVQAKREAPLSALVGHGGAVTISTIAEVTFYGADQAGRSVNAIGRISVTFDDWGDPQ